MAYRNHYLVLTDHTLNAFDIHLTYGMNNFRSYQGGSLEFKPTYFTVDDSNIYVGSVNEDGDSQIETMFFDGNVFSQETMPLALPDETVHAVYTLENEKILVVVDATGTLNEFTYRVVTRSGSANSRQ